MLLNLNRAWRGNVSNATPLPDVWQSLASQHIHFRKGQVCMVAAAPNAGKSMFALIYAIKAKVSTLFFSADTDTATVMIRAASHLSGHSQQMVESNLNNNRHYYDKHLASMENIQFVFDSSPSLDDIELEVKAYKELFGVSPDLIVIDNLMNVMAETDNEWAGLRAIMVEFHDLARNTEACVLVLHHVSEHSEYKINYPPPRRAIHGKVSQLPALILTLAFDVKENILRVSPVKNRFGPHIADGSEYVSLFVNYIVCQINDSNVVGQMYRRDALLESQIQ